MERNKDNILIRKFSVKCKGMTVININYLKP